MEKKPTLGLSLEAEKCNVSKKSGLVLILTQPWLSTKGKGVTETCGSGKQEAKPLAGEWG